MGIESLTVAAQAAGFSMVARDDTELGELKNRDTERGQTVIVEVPQTPEKPNPYMKWFWPFRQKSS